MRFLYLGLFLNLLAACETTPTKVSETQSRELVQVMEKAQKPIEIGEKTIVLDVRSSFDYGLNRVQKALHFPWENLAESRQTGEVLRSTHQAAVRLSLLGITPLSSIVIVGNGPQGHGEEGRLAWTLLYLGLQDVQTATVATFQKTMTSRASPDVENVAPWPVRVRDELQIDKDEFLRWAHKPRERNEQHIFIIDVRSEQEYLGHAEGGGTQSSNPGIDAINIDWTQFFTPQGRPNTRFRGKLGALGIRSSDRIFVVSNHGVRSAAVTYALLSLGYSRAQNFTAGWGGLDK